MSLTLESLLERIRVCEKRLAKLEGVDLIRRFRHHLMYDVPEHYKVELPPRFNAKKRDNFKYLAKLLLENDSVPETWKSGIEYVLKYDRKNTFPFGFWDADDSLTMEDKNIVQFLNAVDPTKKDVFKNMIECSLSCIPPTSRGNGNQKNKAEKKIKEKRALLQKTDDQQMSKSKKLKIKKMNAQEAKKMPLLKEPVDLSKDSSSDSEDLN